MGDGSLREVFAHGGSIYTQSAAALDSTHNAIFLSPSINWRLLTTLLFDERKMLYETFLTHGLFRLLFCRTCDQAVLFLFCLVVYRTVTLTAAIVRGSLETSPEVMNSDLVFAPTFQSTGAVCVSRISSSFSSYFRVVTRYMGSGISTKQWGGIRDHYTAPGSGITSRWDRD